MWKQFHILLALVICSSALLVTGSPCGQLAAGMSKLGDENLPVTVCSLSNGTTGCCPIRDGVCCQDAQYCCPKDFTCDSKQRRCVKDALYIPFHVRIESLDVDVTVGKEILCPDNVTSCKETQTCCIFEGNQYGCCPLLDAVCCDDKKHCCPKNYKCNPSQGKCDRKSTGESIEWLQKLPGIVKQNSVVCPGGSSQCPDGSTCCQLSSGDWGCCPLPQAVCCNDHLHCCPSGYTCDTTSGRCNKGAISLPFYQKIKAAPVVDNKLGSVVCPGNTSQCPDGSTCCQLSSGDYGCCPLPQAVCCNDHLHCCPNGYKCDTTSGRCNKGMISIPFYKKQEAEKLEKPKLESVVCPGGSSQCPDGSTCCQLSSGDWGCCPLPQAVCCNDHLHCCPSGYTCDTTSGRCNKGLISLPFFEKQKATPVVDNKLGSVVCPGNTSQCPDGSTCCQLSSGDYGCCPLPQAVCCNDHLHCCPNGYKCDTTSGRCNKGDVSIPFYHKIKAIPVVENKLGSVVCPGNTSQCPDGSTCCQLSSGDWGCCPLPQAVCCNDHLHCCPNGYTCDTTSGRCNKGSISLPFYQKIKAAPVVDNKLGSVVCPGNTSQCPDGSTCCQLSSGDYGCCPLPQAVCCNDHLHCCPNGYKCDTTSGRCNKGDVSIPFYHKIKAIPVVENKLGSVVCPGNTSQCPDGSTCCQLSSGDYGCCPLPQAVCCNDHLHCCPNGYKCDTTSGRCNKGEVSIPFYPKLPSTKIEEPKVESVVCPGGSSQCPDGSTCCQLSSGDWGCCPLPQAVCCNDHLHCCPSGYTCDTTSGRCNKGAISLPFYQKIKASPVDTKPQIQKEEDAKLVLNKSYNNLTSVVCPDGVSFCPEDYTCCKMSDGSYGCCPLPNAVCCSDHLHCCPTGTKCNMAKQCCDPSGPSGESVAWEAKLPGDKMYIEDEEKSKIKNTPKVAQNPVVCRDNSTCDPLKICCKMQNGGYGCCPYSDGICCEYTSSCCPGGTVCGQVAGDCKPKQVNYHVQYNWHTIELQSGKISPRKMVDSITSGSNVCPGGETKCDAEATCCKRSDNSYSCCPYNNGTCCGSEGYCCPNGYTCDLQNESCTYSDPDAKVQANKVADDTEEDSEEDSEESEEIRERHQKHRHREDFSDEDDDDEDNDDDSQENLFKRYHGRHHN